MKIRWSEGKWFPTLIKGKQFTQVIGNLISHGAESKQSGFEESRVCRQG